MPKKLNIFSLTLIIFGVFMLSIVPMSFAADTSEQASSTNSAESLVAGKAQITKLKNGLTVYILPDERFPLVSTRLYVRAGSAYETPEDAGISHVLEHMVFKGTDKRPVGAVAKEIEAAGGYLNAATSFDYTVYLTDLPSKHWALGIDVVKDMAFHPTLDAKELESEKQVILAELQRSLDNPHSRVFKELQKNALNNTPYSHPIIGFEETILAVTPESMRNYIAKYYQPQNMLLVVVGNINPSEVLAEVQKQFGDINNSSDLVPVSYISAENMDYSSVNVQRGPWNKVYLGLALPVPGNADVRSTTLDILGFVLGGDATSYLYKKYKYEKKLVDEIYVGNYDFERIGMLYFSIQLDADKVEPFWNEFVADMASIKATAFSEKDIERAKLQIEDGIHRVKETLSGLASWRGQLELFLGGEQGEQNILAEVRNVNHESLQLALDTWLVPQRFNVSILAANDAKIPDLEKTLHSLWPAPVSKVASSAISDSKETKIIDLGNNRKVVLIPDSTMPYTSVDFYMTGGDSLVAKDEQGLSALLARTLTSGTKELNAPQMETYLAERAASLSAFAGRQTFGVSMREPSKFDGELFKLFANVLNGPAFREEEIKREKEDQIADIQTRDERALGLAFSQLPQLLFENEHPYAFKSLGDAKNVEKYNRSMVQKLWQKQIQQPWVLSVAGSFDAEQVLAFAKSLPIPTANKQDIVQPKWEKQGKTNLHLPERDQAHLILAFPTVALDHPDSIGLNLLQNALSGQGGLLFTELRDKQGLGYTVTAQNRFSPKAGYTFFYIGTEPEKVDQARKGFAEVIESIHQNELPAEAVQSAKNQMEGDYYRERQSLGSRSSEAALLTILGKDLDFKKKNIEAAQKISAADLRELIKKYINLDNSYEMLVTP